MDNQHITENVMDALKMATITSPVVAQTFFGFALQDWMYIASIVASVFFVLEKIPTVGARIYGWFKRKSSGRSSSTGLTDGESSL